MVSHAELWRGLDTLAAEMGLSASGLAKQAKLDPTLFNPSKRLTPDGRERWPSTESLAKVLNAAGVDLVDFAALVAGIKAPVSDQSDKAVRRIPKLRFEPDRIQASFDAAGLPIGGGWAPIDMPGFQDPHLYTLEITDNMMAPIFRTHDLVVVSPHAPVRQGDRVVVRTVRGELLLRQLFHRTAKRLEVRGFDPAAPVRLFDATLIAWVHRIVWVSQ